MLKWNFPVWFKNTWFTSINQKKKHYGPFWSEKLKIGNFANMFKLRSTVFTEGVLLDGTLQLGLLKSEKVQSHQMHPRCYNYVIDQAITCLRFDWYKYHKIVEKCKCYYCLNIDCFNLTIFITRVKPFFNVLLFLCTWIVCFHELPPRPNRRFVCQGWVNWALCIKENPMAIAMLCSHNIQKK